MNRPIQKVAIIVRPNSKGLKNACLEIFEIFKQHHIDVYLEQDSAKMLGLEGIEFDKILSKVQAIVSIGGDGTLIAAVRKSVGSGLPIFGINMGRLGFLTAIKPNELESFIPMFLDGSYVLDSHSLLEASFAHNPTQKFYALNEILITKKDVFGMVKIFAKIDGESFNTYRADGLIIATPTGSSAYNISAGGSVVHPNCKSILLTPVCPHSLTQRPMVVSDDLHLEFELEEDGEIMIDGQDREAFKKGDMLRICQNQYTSLIQHPNRSYFAVLKEKFSWGGQE